MNQRKLQKLLALIAISSFTSSAYAVAAGFYLGLMGGPATNDAANVYVKTESGTPTMTLVTPSSSQFGTRLFLGYKMNNYVGTELGFTFFSTIAYDSGDIQTCGGTNARARDIDFVGRFSYPFYGVEPYFKAGAALVYASTSGGLNSSPTECGRSKYTTQVKPTYSLGVGYDLTQNWVVDASWNTVLVPGIISRMTYYALGISYHFVDRYCGQFLCDD